MKVKNTTRASHSWYYYHFHQIRMVLFINSSRTVVFISHTYTMMYTCPYNFPIFDLRYKQQQRQQEQNFICKFKV